MLRDLEGRLTSAVIEKALSDRLKLEKERVAQDALAFEESRMLELVKESKTLKQQVVKISQVYINCCKT